MEDIAHVPLENRDTAPFWSACREGRLSIQRCAACGSFRHPPSPVCHRCLSADHEWVAVGGHGRIWSYAVVRERLDGWPGELPLVVVIVELDEKVKLVSNWTGDHDAIHIGMEVEVYFGKGPGDVVLPKFRRFGN